MELLIALLIFSGTISAEDSQTMSKAELEKQAKIIGLEESDDM